jgi:hypothetical protein
MQDGASSFVALYCRFYGSFMGLAEEEEGDRFGRLRLVG